MDSALLPVITVLVLSGLFGGLVNFVRTYIPSNQRVDLTDKSKWGWHFLKCLMTGTAAAFLVPLFLKMISSDVISLDDGKSDYLVLIGFCLVASIFSNRFIDSISEQLLKKVQEVEDTSQHALAISEKNESELAVIVENTTDVKKEEPPETDKLEDEEKNDQSVHEDQGETNLESNDDDKAIKTKLSMESILAWRNLSFGSLRLLDRLQRDVSIFFTWEGMRNLMGWDDEKLGMHLNQLISHEMVRELKAGKGIRYSLTAKGKRFELHLAKRQSRLTQL